MYTGLYYKSRTKVVQLEVGCVLVYMVHDQDVAVGRVAAGADSSQQIASQLQL